MEAEDSGSALSPVTFPSSLSHSIVLPPFTFLLSLVCLFGLSAASFSLPFLLTSNDTFSRRSILLLTTALCCQGGVLLSWAFFGALDGSLALATSVGRSSFLPLLLFVFGLLFPATLERLLLLLGGAVVRRWRAREAELEEEEEQQRLFTQHQREEVERGGAGGSGSAGQGTPGSRSAATSSSASPSGASQPASGGRFARVGRRDEAPNPLLPPPVKDYRVKRSLDELSEEEEEADFDEDQLSPFLYSASQPSQFSSLLSHSSASSRASYHSYGLPVVDATSFIAEQRYVARCVFCKENVATRKAAAYHAAGCPLKHLHAFTVSSHSLAALRGKRQMTLDDQRIPPHLLTLIALTEGVGLNLALGNAVALTWQSLASSPSALLPLLSGLLSLLCLVAFSAFTTALTVRQQRASTAFAVAAGLVASLMLPCSALLFAAVLPGLGSAAVALYEAGLFAWLGGVACWVSLVDVLLEEMERKDAKEGKWLAFVVGFVISAAAAACAG